MKTLQGYEENTYYHLKLTPESIRNKAHRREVGGLWETVSALVFDYLVNNYGLRPGHRLLDLGCGSFRCGLSLIAYLDAGNYYGLDVNEDLVQAGFMEVEEKGLTTRLNRSHIVCNNTFDLSAYQASFDFVLAQSLWPHLTLNTIEVSLAAVSVKLASGGVFLATFFSCPDDTPLLGPLHHEPGGIVTYRHKDPFHHKPADFEHIIRQLHLPLKMTVIGDWGTPEPSTSSNSGDNIAT